MKPYKVTMCRAANLSDEEVSQRLHRVYSLILSLANEPDNDKSIEESDAHEASGISSQVIHEQ